MLLIKKSQLPNDLIARIAKGGICGRRAVNQLHDHFHYMIRNGQQAFQLPETEATSAFNQALTSMVEAIRSGSFRGDSTLKTYLHRAFTNQCINFSKQLQRHMNRTVELEDYQCSDAQATSDRQLIAKEKLAVVLSCLHQLNSKAYAILWGAAYHGYTSQEIAEKNGFKNAATVDVLKTRYRKQLSEMTKDAA